MKTFHWTRLAAVLLLMFSVGRVKDVSYWQTEIDFSKYASAGVKWVSQAIFVRREYNLCTKS